jgi:D-sedoheptulose 7-phosphate isomerase
MHDLQNRVRRSIASSLSVKQRLLADSEVLSNTAAACEATVRALRQGGKILLFGNGGSAADAQHIAAEFVGRFAFDRPALPAMALSVNTSCVTAIGNDYGFENVFSRQVEAFGRRGDVAIGISTSGNSRNVLLGVAAARGMGLPTIGLTSQSGGKLRAAVEHCICVPSEETPRIQECHILIGHILAELVEQDLFHEQHAAVTARQG